LIQSKTRVEIWLPMSISVGNAIYRYIKEGRPSVIDDSHVFLKARAPYGLISPAVCRHAMERVLPERNILGSKFHVTRRTFATDLLKKGTKTSMIADALGHSNIGTIHKYLSLDEERMRLCSLSLTEIGLMSDRRTWNE
jgi:site-specific recombinase XerD